MNPLYMKFYVDHVKGQGGRVKNGDQMSYLYPQVFINGI